MSFCAEGEVVEVRTALVQGQVEGVVGVVIEVRPGRDDPVDEPGPDERDQAAHPQPGRGQGAEIVSPTVQSGSSIFRVKTWQTSRSRPPL